MNNFARHFPRLRALALVAVLALTGASGATAQSEFDKYLRGERYDKDLLLDQVQEPDEWTAPLESTALFDASNMALVLPLDAPGYLGEVANIFLEGFILSAEAEGARFTLETYRTDGDPQSGLAAYRQAVIGGAGFVVGPLLRSSVEQVALLPAEATVPTLLLQEPPNRVHAGQIGAPSLYSFPLGGESEAIQFAADISARRGTAWVFVLVEPTALGDRLARSFETAWRIRGNSPAYVRRIVSAESWVPIHEEIRRILLRDAEQGPDALFGVASQDDDAPGHVSVFAAGGHEFASETRANVPTAVPVYAMSAVHADLFRSGRNLLGLDGIRFFEMPYVLGVREGRASELVAAELAADLPVGLQRYLAAGIDAYRIASRFPQWGGRAYWQIEGDTGLVSLDDGRFLRNGVLLELSEGLLVNVDEDGEEPQ